MAPRHNSKVILQRPGPYRHLNPGRPRMGPPRELGYTAIFNPAIALPPETFKVQLPSYIHAPYCGCWAINTLAEPRLTEILLRPGFTYVFLLMEHFDVEEFKKEVVLNELASKIGPIMDVRFDMGSMNGCGMPVLPGLQNPEDLQNGLDYPLARFYKFEEIIVHFWWHGYPGQIFPVAIPTTSGRNPITRNELGSLLTKALSELHQFLAVTKKYPSIPELAFVEDDKPYPGVPLHELRLLSLTHCRGRHFVATLSASGAINHNGNSVMAQNLVYGGQANYIA
ncbi:hypothetical protein K474DRAFT_1673932 [Panus rudis PR-1116 ss-1]|nr:hypothetical protein K474DRAFT_1673932 [Panus rudis PR-1116 ss-1]